MSSFSSQSRSHQFEHDEEKEQELKMLINYQKIDEDNISENKTPYGKISRVEKNQRIPGKIYSSKKN
jgi:hypothetical protein